MTQNNDLIVCLIGESGCGKTTVAKVLEEKGYNVIQSYTTRQAREENEWGHTFVDINDIKFTNDYHAVQFFDTTRFEHIIAYVYYHHNHYWATVEQYADKGVSIYIIDPEGFVDLKKKVSAPIIGIYLRLDIADRLHRLIGRDGEGKAYERVLNDEDAFRTILTDWALNVTGISPDDIAIHIEDIIKKSLLSPHTVISQ